MSQQVSSRKPFGLPTNARPTKKGDIVLRWNDGEGPYFRKDIEVGVELIDKWKVITSYVGYDHAGNPGKDGKRRVFSKIDILPPGTICTETYLVVGSYDNEKYAINLVNYMKTKFFRFLVSQFMYSHHITKESYSLVPQLDMTKNWTDQKLYARYGISIEEQAFIETKIKSMDPSNE
jgi:site-specific DNA-methyltransferase (adenine-specific)